MDMAVGTPFDGRQRAFRLHRAKTTMSGTCFRREGSRAINNTIGDTTPSRTVPTGYPLFIDLANQMMEAGGGQDHWGGGGGGGASSASSSSSSKMTRLRNAVRPDNKGKGKAGLSGGGMSGGGGGGGSKVNDAKCAAGVIENVCLLGAPVGASTARWERVARVVHGRIVNGYSKSDIILGLVFRAKSLSLSVSGIQKVGRCAVGPASFYLCWCTRFFLNGSLFRPAPSHQCVGLAASPRRGDV